MQLIFMTRTKDLPEVRGLYEKLLNDIVAKYAGQAFQYDLSCGPQETFILKRRSGESLVFDGERGKERNLTLENFLEMRLLE